MTALENKIQELWFLVTSPVEVEEEIKIKCQSIFLLGGDVNADQVIKLSRKVQPLAKDCYNLEIPMEKILESIPEDLEESFLDNLSWHLASVRESVKDRIQSVEEELSKLHSASWLKKNQIQESLAKISDGLIPAHIDTLVDSKYGCMTNEFADEVFLDLREKTIDSGAELKIDTLRFQMSSDGKEIISDPVTYRFVCGGTNDIITCASFYDAVLNANLISSRHGLQPVYELVLSEMKEDTSFIQYLKRIVSGDLNPQNFGKVLSEEEIQNLKEFFEDNCGLGTVLRNEDEDHCIQDEDYCIEDIEDEDLYCYFDIVKIKEKISQLEEFQKQGLKSFAGQYYLNLNPKANGYQLISLEDNQNYLGVDKNQTDLVFSDLVYHQVSLRNNVAYYEGCDLLVASNKQPETPWSSGYYKTDRIFGFRLKRKI
jgi:hypothetical protein